MKYTFSVSGASGLDFKAVAVVKRSNGNFDINDLNGKKACHPGVGHAAGWIFPIATLIEKRLMPIEECNVPVKSAAAYFGNMCAPNGLARFYNPFGEPFKKTLNLYVILVLIPCPYCMTK